MLRSDQDFLRVRFEYIDAAAEWRLPTQKPGATILLSGKALDEFAGGDDTEVLLTDEGKDGVEARWLDAGVPRTRVFPAVAMDRSSPFPEPPKRFHAMDVGILRALDDAAQTAARDSVHPGVTRLQLRGKRGEIASTDRHQLLLQRGFTFPWQEDLLVPTIGVFACKELAPVESVGVGRTESHVSIDVGAWTFFLKIDTDGKFPRIEQGVPAQFTKGTAIHITPEDAQFLAEKLPRLPGANNEDKEITIEATGTVAIRAKDEGRAEATEILLSRSRSTGPTAKFVGNRSYLARALQFGFREFYIARQDVAMVARDRRRLYVWVHLSAETAIPAAAVANRLESAAGTQTAPQEPQPERRTKPMPASTTNGHANNGNNTNGDRDRTERSPAVAELITEAEELRTVLADASARLSRLLSGLKANRRQSRAVQAAVHSLKQLQLDG
jgi:hypothetical protein